jgi:hypothetical protein
MITAIISFLAGLFLAPIIRPLLRPFFVELVKFSYQTMEEAKQAVAKVKEEVSDAVAVANAEQEIKNQAKHDEKKPSGDASS